MKPMMLNYILMVLFGGFSALSIISRCTKGHYIGRPIRTFLCAAVFILALVATVMHMPVTELQHLIERMGRS